MIYKIDRKQLAGNNYDWLFKINVGYYIMLTAKGAKKSRATAIKIVTDMLLDKRMSGIILRKYAKDHADTTFSAIQKTFEIIKSKTGYDYEKDWDLKCSNQEIRVYNHKTKQMIRFASFDRYDSIAGFETKTHNGYFGFIWWEEPVQKNDKNLNDFSEDQLITDFWSIQNTIMRGILPSGAKRNIYLTFNDWNPDGQINQEFIFPYISKNDKKLFEKGAQLFHHPTAFGNGMIIFFATALVNEFVDEDTKTLWKHLQKTNPEIFNVIIGGAGANFSGDAYGSENLKKVKQIKNIDEIIPGILTIGIDYSSKRDKTVLTLTIISPDGWNIQIIDYWCYDHKNAKVKLSDVEQVELMFIWLIKKIEFFKSIGKTTNIARATAFVDSKETVIRSMLNKKREINSWSHHLINNFVKAKKFGIAGNIIRVKAVRLLMASDRISLTEKAYSFFMNEWAVRKLDKHGKPFDGNDDASQSFEYSITNYFDTIFTREQMNIFKMIVGEYAKITNRPIFNRS